MASAETLKADDPSALERATAVIRKGGVVALPTETFYGLAADGHHRIATSRVFEIKGRPAGMALPLVAGSVQQVVEVFGPIDKATAAAMHAFWPGPLSLVMPNGAAVRVPAHEFVRALCRNAGVVLTSTSANLTGEPPAETAEAVFAALGDRVDLIIDGGATPGGKPSTIADLRGESPVLIRDGAVAWDTVLAALK